MRSVILGVLALGVVLSAETAEAFPYRVTRGDTLSGLASRFGVSVDAIRAENGLTGSLIVVGEVIEIPDRNARTDDPREAEDETGDPIHYTVRSGDWLGRIADRFGVSVYELKAANGLSSNTIHPGDVLTIPTGDDVSSGDGYPDTGVHPRMTVSSSHLEVLARIVKGECPGNMPYEGMVAVAAVVLNRVRHERFPSSIPGVAHQPLQFSCYNPRYRQRLYYGPIPDYAWEAAREALAGADPTNGCTHYFNPYLVSPSWRHNLDFVRRIGTTRTTTHDFYRYPGFRGFTDVVNDGR